MDQLWSASWADDVSSREAWPGLLYTPPSLDSAPHVKTVPQSEMHRNVKRKRKIGIASSNLTEMQNKSSVANKLVDVAMGNMYCKIIAFALFHIYFVILYFCLQNLFSSCNTSFSFAILYFCLQKAHNFFSILKSSFANNIFSFAIL